MALPSLEVRLLGGGGGVYWVWGVGTQSLDGRDNCIFNMIRLCCLCDSFSCHLTVSLVSSVPPVSSVYVPVLESVSASAVVSVSAVIPVSCVVPVLCP